MSSPSSFQRRGWQIAALLVVTVAIASCARNLYAEVWWNKEASYGIPHAARLINQASSPLLVSDLERKNLGNSLALSYLLEAKVRFRPLRDAGMLRDLDGFTDVFFLAPSESFRQQLEKAGYQAKEVANPLWRLQRDSSRKDPVF